MHARTLGDLVGGFLVGVKRNSDDPRIVGSILFKDVAVCAIVSGRKHLLDVKA